MRHLLSILVTTALVVAEARRAEAGIIVSHQGTTNPTTEGFSGVTVVAPASTAGPLASDLGLPVWQIKGSGQSSQYVYAAPGLTSSQQSDIASQGFTETLDARVLSNGLAPAYSSSDPVTIGDSLVSYAGVRWEIDLGLNSAGDTVVVLPTSVSTGPGNSVRSFGPSYTLTGSGSTYHTYQLQYNPVTHLANLSVDGTVVLMNYSGNASFYYNTALSFGAYSGGEGNFSSVEVKSGLASVPEPSGFVLMAIGIVGLIGVARRRGRLAA